MCFSVSKFRILLLLLSVALSACVSKPELRPFTSDGCSLFPDRAFFSDADWCECCVEHDRAYWRGGSRKERKAADKALQTCIASKTDSDALAWLMYRGVRIGGTPYLYSWFRWGYGWKGLRGYEPLDEAEAAEADKTMANTGAAALRHVCVH